MKTAFLLLAAAALVMTLCLSTSVAMPSGLAESTERMVAETARGAERGDSSAEIAHGRQKRQRYCSNCLGRRRRSVEVMRFRRDCFCPLFFG